MGKGDLEVELSELRLPVSAQVLITEALDELEVAVDSTDHEQLLKQLRRLGQRVELSGRDSARDKEVTCSFRCRLGEKRGLDFQKADVGEIISNYFEDTMAKGEVSLQSLTSQINVTVA